MEREVAQSGSVPGLGPGGRRFESCLPDEVHQSLSKLLGLFYLYSTKAHFNKLLFSLGRSNFFLILYR